MIYMALYNRVLKIYYNRVFKIKTFYDLLLHF